MSLTLALALLLVAALAVPAQAQMAPDVIPLPNGFQPEGIALGPGSTFYVGSLATGAIYSGDLRTGEGAILVPDQEDRVAVGLGFDNWSRNLFVAGGAGGAAYVYDTQTGESLAEYPLVDPASTGTFVNDVVVTEDAAYLTDSMRPVFYRIPLGENGRLPDPSAVEEIELSGDFEFVEGEFNSNGIAATPNGQVLFIINSFTGALYRVNPQTGEATEIEVTGGELTMGDGLFLDGQTLYVVRNRLNEIAVVVLGPGFQTGRVVDTITSDLFDVPTTIAKFGPWLYAVNARFGTTPTPDTEYNVVRVPVEP
ncbi:MAG TPA: superoxide dismutase [Anaerolineae bacterium]|nr:superoxide dismutase [Anaerolineae bacterium]